MLLGERAMEIKRLKERESDKNSPIETHMAFIESLKNKKDKKIVMGLYGLKCIGTFSWVSHYESLIFAEIEGRRYVADPTRGNHWMIREVFDGEADYLSALFLEKTASIEQSIYENGAGSRGVPFTDLLVDKGIIGVYWNKQQKAEIKIDPISIYMEAAGLYRAGGISKASREGRTVGYIKSGSVQRKIQSMIVDHCSKGIQTFYEELRQFNREKGKTRSLVLNMFGLLTSPFSSAYGQLRIKLKRIRKR